jgi:hypothetical protein
MKNTLTILANTLNKSKVYYSLIRPINLDNLNTIGDIDILMTEESLFDFFIYLKDNNIDFECRDTYLPNKIIILLYNFILDIDINKTVFTEVKIVGIDNDILIFDKFYINDLAYFNIFPEPYLFINWTFHYILDKKSFMKGSTHNLYKKKYKKKYKQILKNDISISLIKQLFKYKTFYIIETLENTLFIDDKILNNKIIFSFNKIIFSFNKILKIYYLIFRIHFALKRRIDKYVFRKNKKYTDCIRNIRLFSK